VGAALTRLFVEDAFGPPRNALQRFVIPAIVATPHFPFKLSNSPSRPNATVFRLGF
jgi:hypothetical protein